MLRSGWCLFNYNCVSEVYVGWELISVHNTTHSADVLVPCVSATITFTAATSSATLKRDIVVQVHSHRCALEVFLLYLLNVQILPGCWTQMCMTEEWRLTRHSQSSSWGSSPFSWGCIQDLQVPPPLLPPELSSAQCGCRLCSVAGCCSEAGCSCVCPSCCTGRQRGRHVAANTDTLPGSGSSAWGATVREQGAHLNETNTFILPLKNSFCHLSEEVNLVPESGHTGRKSSV